jgi:hypothetical protein
MARLPSRRELADRINDLERDLKIVSAAAAAGYGARALGGAGFASRAGTAIAGPVARMSPQLALADLIIRQEESIPIKNAKRAFTAVTKTASKINKGGKVAKSGITRKIGLAVKRILK